MMKKRIFLSAVIVAAGIGWIVSTVYKPKPETAKTTVPERAAGDQQLVDTVLDAPEALDGERESPGVRREAQRHAAPVPAEPDFPLPTGKERHLLSDIEKPPAPQPLKEPVAADSLHFHRDYASLRTDAVRNPDSAQNRAGVVSLMQARQRRLEESK